MALPQPDPSLPGGAAPVFGDTDAARGDHLRANNQAIWENLEYLNDGTNINDADAATPVDADRVGFFQIAGAVIKCVTFANLFLWVITKVAALASKTTPVDSDSVLLIDSEASNVGKRLTFTNLKALLKTYFDTLYVKNGSWGTWFAHTFSGYGSIANKIPYYTTVLTNAPGGTFTVANSSTNGLSVTADVSGLFAITTWFSPSAGEYLGISVNSSELTTSILSIAAGDRIALSCGVSAGVTALTTVTLKLSAGDVVRPHTTGVSASNAVLAGFRVEFIRAVS